MCDTILTKEMLSTMALIRTDEEDALGEELQLKVLLGRYTGNDEEVDLDTDRFYPVAGIWCDGAVPTDPDSWSVELDLDYLNDKITRYLKFTELEIKIVNP